MKRFFRYAGIGIGCIVALPIVYVFVPILLNNIQVQIEARKLNDISHPSQSRYLKRILAVANYGIASNQCDFAAGEFRATTLSKKETEDFYAPLVDSTMSLTANPTYNIYFADEVDEIERNQDLGIYGDLLGSYALKPIPDEQVYLFLIVDAKPPGLDIRCH